MEPVAPFGLVLGVTTAAGVAVFLFGHAAYRAALALGSGRPHVAGALALASAALSTVPAVGSLAVLMLLGGSWRVSR